MATPQPALLRRDLIAMAGYGWRGQRRLPPVEPDEATGIRITSSTYDQMACDSEVAAALWLLVYSVLADGVQLAPAVSDKDERFEQATEITEHSERTIDGLRRPLRETLEMLIRDALTYGNKVAEKVYDIPKEGADANRLVLSSIKVKRRGAVSFVVDEYWNLVGLTSSVYVVGNQLQDGAQIVPAEKFVICTYRMKDEDPRGQSLFRPAVKAWNIKQLSWPEFLAYLMRCAIPGLVAELSENVNDELLRDESGNLVLDGSGNPVKVSAALVMLNALLQFKNSTALVVENGTKIMPLEVKGKGEIWPASFGLLNKEIRKGLLLQELATADAEHQTKSAGESQMGIVELLVWATKAWVADIVRCQILMPQIGYNFGEMAAKELTPKVSLGDTSRKDWADDSAAAVALIEAVAMDADGIDSPVLTYSQAQALLTQIGLPAPTEEEVNEIRIRAEERRQERERMKEQTQPEDDGQQAGE